MYYIIFKNGLEVLGPFNTYSEAENVYNANVDNGCENLIIVKVVQG